MLPGNALWPLGLLPAEQAESNRTAIRNVDGSTVTYAGLYRGAAGLATQLSTVVSPGDRVMLRASSSSDWLVGFFAILGVGAVVVPVDPAANDNEVAAFVEATQARAIVQLNEDEVPHDLAAVQIGAVGDQEQQQWVERDDQDVALIVATSGTWGKQRAVSLTATNLRYMVSTLAPLQQARPDDVWLSVLPLHHMMELACAVLPALHTGATVCFLDSLNPDDIIHAMQSHGVTKMMTVPLLLDFLRRRLAVDTTALPSSLQALYCGGAALAPEVTEFFASLGVPVYSGYGLTETSPTVAVNHPGASRLGSVGKALPGTEVRVDTSTSELLVRGPGIMAGYWNDPTATASTIRDGWLHTGDLARIDEGGYVYVIGRLKNLIVLPSGANVQPEEVEAQLGNSPLWTEAAVTGAFEVCVIVSLTGGREMPTYAAVEDEVARRCRNLRPFKRPTRVQVVTEPLPKTAKRSIDRQALLRLSQVQHVG